jgi:two-component system, sensor histidine kinase SagS
VAKLLLVEDEELAQIALQGIIRNMGHEIDVVDTAENALNRLLDNDNSYDLIFLDIGLPDASGTVLSKEMREIFNFNAPIIAVTGSMPQERWEECKRVGVDDFILKPVTIEKINKVFERYLKVTN